MPHLDWRPDILDGYRQHVFDLGPDPDGEGDVAAVLIRREVLPGEIVRGTVLYVHGFSDYFFQTELADFFAARGLAFYALDLRKCGRARRAGQTAHYVSDLELYDRELELALAALAAEHPGEPTLLVAHSTGGLILPLWLARRRRSAGGVGGVGGGGGIGGDGGAEAAAAPAPVPQVSGLVLNSPWFDLQGGGAVRRNALTAAVRVLAGTSPRRPLKLPTSLYGATLHVSGTGEWEFDLDLKPIAGFPVTPGWLSAVRRGHARLHRGLDIGVPSLILRSDRTHFSRRYTDASDQADLVLDVAQIARWAGCLGGETTIVPVAGARHDVFLSRRPARERAYEVLGEWLVRVRPVTDGSWGLLEEETSLG